MTSSNPSDSCGFIPGNSTFKSVLRSRSFNSDPPSNCDRIEKRLRKTLPPQEHVASQLKRSASPMRSPQKRQRSKMDLDSTLSDEY
ncbi:hypothetical protein TrRE_jg9865 [Triparma retinervis]|uniref:Uncharacterized protein n=1 Tax=Triparma retinervis TaxID=2557542 RepID=A0A9W7CII9_9STRA|nr:hypothetical protein TrRE_jg9865 [Triparma retinervis]